MKIENGEMPKNNPSGLIRLRDSIYATDLFIAAAGWFDFFTFLGQHPGNIDEICSSLKIEKRPADVMLSLFASMGLIRSTGGKYTLTEMAEEFLVKGSPGSLIPYLETMKDRPACADMVNILKTGNPASWGSKKDEKEWVKAIQSDDVAEKFTAAMDSRGAYLAPAMARQIDLRNYSNVLDIAGGSGIYACAVATAHAHIRATVFEKPPVDNAARFLLAQKGMVDQIDVMSGDMLNSLPEGFDVHLLSNVLHDWGEENVCTIMKNSFAAMAPGGLLIIHDAHLNEDKTGPLPVAEFSVLLMYSTEGKCYSVKEMQDMLEATGFIDIQIAPTAAWRSVITAKKPKSIIRMGR